MVLYLSHYKLINNQDLKIIAKLRAVANEWNNFHKTGKPGVVELPSWLEPVTEHLVGREGQPRGAQVYAMYLRDQKGWARIHSFPDLIYGLAVEARVFCWRFLPTWDFPKEAMTL